MVAEMVVSWAVWTVALMDILMVDKKVDRTVEKMVEMMAS